MVSVCGVCLCSLGLLALPAGAAPQRGGRGHGHAGHGHVGRRQYHHGQAYHRHYHQGQGSPYSSSDCSDVDPCYNSAPEYDTAAHIEVKVPACAEVWFEGTKTRTTGPVRHYVSPPLTPGQDYSYDIRARWTDPDGKVEDLTRDVLVGAGGQVVVNFTDSAPAQ
jgi:uncharacterized protein (TIGR03000 family)